VTQTEAFLLLKKLSLAFDGELSLIEVLFRLGESNLDNLISSIFYLLLHICESSFIITGFFVYSMITESRWACRCIGEIEVKVRGPFRVMG
jgi:hypothetical protein